MYSKIRKVLAMILAIVLAVPAAAQFTLSVTAASGTYEGRNIHIASSADVVNLTEEYLPQLSGLEQGTISVRYRSNASQGLSALFSLSSTAAGENNTYAVAYVNPAGGKAGVEVRSTSPATNYNQVSASADIQDDAWHTVTYVFGASSFQIYADGEKIADQAKNGFFSKISNASSVKVGALDRTSGLNNWLFKGDIDLISVTGQIVSEDEIRKLHEATIYEKQLPPEPEGSNRTDTRLFYNGYSNSAAYRIPSLLTTQNGVTIAAIDKRQSGSGDQGNIDTMIRRSLDGGLTWEEPQILINLPSGEKRHSLTIDCNMVQDETTGRIFLMADMFPESNAIMDAPTLVTSSGYKTVDGKRYLILRDCPNSATENTYTKEYTIRENGIVWDESTNKPTDYVVPDQTEGTLYQKVNAAALNAVNSSLNSVSQSDVSGNETSGTPETSRQDDPNTTEPNTAEPDTAESDTDNTVSGNVPASLEASAPFTDSMNAVGNIFLYTGSNAAPLKVIRTSYLWIVYSDDDGATWSDPVDITGMVKADWMKFSGTGPGRGIQMSSGRLVLPVYVTNSNVGASQSAAVIYSDDHGETWTMGETVNDGIISGGTEHMTGGAMMTESQVVEVTQKDGSKALKLFCRNGGGNVAIATSHDGGATWEDSLPKDSVLKDAYCQLTVMSYPYTVPGYEGRQMFVFANPNSTYSAGRNHGTLRLGYYDENTDSFVWIASRLIESTQYAYSCLSVLEDNKIAVLWEGKNLDINFSTFNLEWLMADQTPINGPAPEVVSINWQNGSIAVEFDQPMLVAGMPVLKAASGTSSVSLPYESGSGSKVLVFRTDLPDTNRLTFTGIEQSGSSSYGNCINQAVAEGGFDGFTAEPSIASNIEGTNAAAGYESVEITFTPNQKDTVYEVFRSESENGSFIKVGAAENGSFVDHAGTGKICWYKVKSQDGKQVSDVFCNSLPTGMEALQNNALLFEKINVLFDGTTLIDLSDRINDIKNVSNGSIIIKFKTDSKDPASVLLMAKKSGEAASYNGGGRKIALSLTDSQNDGSRYFRADLSHTRANFIGSPASNLSDGEWHTLVYSSEAGAKAMRAVIDGKEVKSFSGANNEGIFNKLTGTVNDWDQLTIGGYYNTSADKVENGFKGSIAYIAVTDEVLSDAGAAAISGMKDPVITAVRPGYSSIRLTLDLPEGNNIFDIYRSDKIDGAYEKIGSTSAAAYVDAAGTGATWYYQVKSPDGLSASGCVGNDIPTGLEAMKDNALVYKDVHETVFDGSTLVDISDQAGSVDGLEKGSIIVRFKTNTKGSHAAMLVGKTSGETAGITGAGNKAAILLESQNNMMSLRGDFAHTRASLKTVDSADGEWHTAIIINDTTASDTFRFTLDGQELASFNAGNNDANVGFFSTVNNLNQLTIGGYYNGNNTDVANGFKGEIDYILITDEVFSTEDANAISKTDDIPYYTVTFLGRDGVVLKTEEVLKGGSASAPQAPEVDGYTFKEWDMDFSNVQSDLTIKAVYDKIPVYTVTFLGKDGTVLKTQEVLKGGRADAPQAPGVDGYTFKGWDKDFSNIQNDMTVNALYETTIVKPSEESKNAMTLLLADAGQKVPGEYTKENWDLFLAAKASAEKAMTTENISQEDFNKAAAELRKAMDNLSKTDTNQGGNDNNGSNDNNGNNDGSDNNNTDVNDSSQDNQADHDTSAVVSPKTSDSNIAVLPAILLMVMTGITLVVLSRKKHKNK